VKPDDDIGLVIARAPGAVQVAVDEVERVLRSQHDTDTLDGTAPVERRDVAIELRKFGLRQIGLRQGDRRERLRLPARGTESLAAQSRQPPRVAGGRAEDDDHE
jgi:hypothetical protein